MKFAAILARDGRRRAWWPIGVLAVNSLGYARIKMASGDKLVATTPAFACLEENYNTVLEEGEITWEELQADGNTGIGRLRTDDPQFIERYAEQLNSMDRDIRLGPVLTFTEENIDENLPKLLDEVRSRTYELQY